MKIKKNSTTSKKRKTNTKKKTLSANAKRKAKQFQREAAIFQRGILFGFISNGLSQTVGEELERSPWLQKLGITKKELANETMNSLCDELGAAPMTPTEIKLYDLEMRKIIAILSEVIRTRETLNSMTNKMRKTLSYKERLNLK